MKGKYGILAALFVTLVMCMGVFGTAKADFTFNKLGGYSGTPGSATNIIVDTHSGSYNLTSDQVKDAGYEFPRLLLSPYVNVPLMSTNIIKRLTRAEINAITDFDSSTSFQLTDAGQMKSDYYWFDLKVPVDSFSGVWMKKSVDITNGYTEANLFVQNNTIGYASNAYLLYGDNYQDHTDFSALSNLSYQQTPYILDPSNNQPITFSTYVNEYGSIDNISVSWDQYSSFNHPIPMSPVHNSPNVDIELLWYEFHIDLAPTTINQIVVTNNLGITQFSWGDNKYTSNAYAWGATITTVSTGVYNIALSVPRSVTTGTYWVSVLDSTGANKTTTLDVEASQNNIWYWIYPLIFFTLCAGCFAAAGIFAKTKYKITTVVIIIMAVVFGAFAVVTTTDLMTWTNFGVLPHLPMTNSGFIAAPMLGAMVVGGWDGIRKTYKNHKKAFKSFFCLTLIGSMVLMSLAICATSTATTYTTSPPNETVKPGDSFVITVTSNSTKIIVADSTETIIKADQTTPGAVIWKYAITLSDDKLTEYVTITVPSGAPIGTYAIYSNVYNGQEVQTTYNTCYVQAPGLNWVFCAVVFLSATMFVGIFAIGWKTVKKTKTPWDDRALLVLFSVAVIEYFVLVVYLFEGYIYNIWFI